MTTVRVMPIQVRSHIRRPRGRWPFAVRQHIRHRWVLPKGKRHTPPFDEYGGERDGFVFSKPRVVEVDPALILLGADPEANRRQIAEFLNSSYEGPSTRIYIQNLRTGVPMDPVEIGLDKSGDERMFGGAHRTTAAIASGIRRMPVAFYDYESGGPASPKQVQKWKRRAEKRVWDTVAARKTD